MGHFNEKRKILPTITTTKNSDWEEKIREINEMELNEVALFPTCLNIAARKKLYKLLKASSVKSIPFVHLRGDMTLEELDYFVQEYGTNTFNIHSRSEYPIPKQYLKYKDIIFIENVFNPLNEEELKNLSGICLDLSHLENDKITEREKFEHNLKVLEKYPIGCNHISCLKKVSHVETITFAHQDVIRYDEHFFEDFSELDYLKSYPLKYFSSVIALELENNIKEQLKVKEYLEKIYAENK